MKITRWGVLGVGRAGTARAAAIRVTDGCELVGHWSRRDGTPPLRAMAEARPEVVVVALEDAAHATGILEALEAGADVLVEYPLVTSREEAVLVAEAARRVGRGIRVSWLGWQGPQGEAIRLREQQRPPRVWDVHFRGGLAPWVAEGLRRGRHATHAAGRLRMLWDLVGPWAETDATVSRDGESWLAAFLLAGPEGRSASLREERGQGLARSTGWWADGEPVVPAQGSQNGAFARDQSRWQESYRKGTWGVGLPAEELAFLEACLALEERLKEKGFVSEVH
ncbi:MAG: Gfo/Idh/MocA family oxidoreductase [Candidatus Sericytochromatia bacterium]|nr:Gfo/Idh/MocA family oxidoreductase [Candidatus Sericytochromatia bacterium]